MLTKEKRHFMKLGMDHSPLFLESISFLNIWTQKIKNKNQRTKKTKQPPPNHKNRKEN